jgi:hypothetical protein
MQSVDSVYYNKEEQEDPDQEHVMVDSSDFSLQKSKVAGFSFLGQEALSAGQLKRLSSQFGSLQD